MRISDWSSDVCSSDLAGKALPADADQRLRDRAAERVAGAGQDDDVRGELLERDLHREREVIGRENLMAESLIPHIGRIAGEAAPDMATAVEQRQRVHAEQRRRQHRFSLYRAAPTLSA